MRRVLLYVSILTLLGSSVLSIEGFAEEKTQYESNSLVEFIPNLEPTYPVNPENPDPEKPVRPVDPTKPDGPDPGTSGPLSIDYASSLKFGNNRISNKDQVYFARAQAYQDNQGNTANFVQISDNRGTNSGWTLKVKQSEQLTATSKTLNNVLAGAQIMLANPTVNSNAVSMLKPEAMEKVILVPGEESVLVAAKTGSGAGTWSTYWGEVVEIKERDEHGQIQTVSVTKDIQLAVPGYTPKDAVTYQTSLIWTLTDVPEI
ncbi:MULTISPECIES: WxL domain-containing protein [unclassified Enterococcus]|uniref:WxL domain-containing protein n=1 Tax=unclassified Enterococcus TaxID=2608891 RepID=UPI001A9AA312|nr:WxL domain-containing protein [Enterococcus sp. DIV1271a]MBO1300636.1 WxL domain-containing protein [Enterococcus sp. DIV1271a]